MAEFTPTTDIVRSRYTEFPYVSQIKDEPGDPAEFDRWLAKHDAKVRKATLAGAAAVAEKHVMYAEHCAGCSMATVIASELRSVTEAAQ